MGKTRAYRIFTTFLLSYLLILLLPVSGLTFVVYHAFVNKLEEETVQGNLNTLDKVRYVMDEQLKRLEDTTYQMMLEDNRLSLFRVSGDHGYKAWGIVSELKRIQKMNPFVHEIWLYYRAESSVYTSSSVYALPMLADQIYQFDDWRGEELSRDLNSVSERVIKPPAMDRIGQERFMRVIVPVLPYRNQPYASVVYLIKESAIQQLLSNLIPTGGSTWILDPENRPVAGAGAVGKAQAEQVSVLSAAAAPGSQRVTIGKEDHYVFSIRSKQSGWTYVTLVPVKLVLGRLAQAQTLFLYGGAVVLVIGALFVFLGMRWNYRPIRQLQRETEQLLSPEGPALNELETVRYAIASLADRNRLLDERVRSHAAAAKKQLLLSLVKGDFGSEDELRLHADEIGLPIGGTRFRAAILHLASADGGSDREMGVETLELLLLSLLPGYAAEHMEPGKLILILLTDGLGEADVEHAVEAFRQSVHAVWSGSATIGLGRECELTGLPRSYLEANTAIEYRFIQGLNRIIEFGMIPSDRSLTPYPSGELELLDQSIRAGQSAKVEASLSAMLKYVRGSQPPLLVVRSLCLEIIRTVNKAWDELGLQEQSSSVFPDVFALERLDTLDDFEGLIRSVCSDLCGAFRSAQGAETPLRTLDLMLAYIHEHYRSCDFSVQGMARHFGMAVPNLSQYFKDQTGETLLDYTTRLRIEKVKELLASQDLPVKTIAEQVGYHNVSSFIRRFKQLTGVTPGEYRLQMK
ncbi:helix-turn-helix domain-containing protein [Paenibacillus sp. S-38]|uniref:helix-turn-helix domain-containing protein n=1 Tax=Paenibacillus sp. S-38 TaxID=3416710 RepID=UPI003CEE8E52